MSEVLPMVLTPSLLMDIYDLAREGKTDTTIQTILNIPKETWFEWAKDKRVFANSLERARKYVSSAKKNGNATKGETFRDFVYRRLSPQLQKLWYQLVEWKKPNEDGVLDRLEDARRLLASMGKRCRQHLFFYAYVYFNFNPSEALRFVNITRTTLNDWVNNDPKFSELMQEIHWHKGNFYEGALVKLVRKGEPSAVIFANKTFNKDRGYSEKVAIEHSGTVQHTHSLEELDLPVETAEEILRAIRRKNEPQLEDHSNVVDVDFEETALHQVPDS